MASSKLAQEEVVARLGTAFTSDGLQCSAAIAAIFSDPAVAAGKVYITWRRTMHQNILTGINKHLKLRVQTQLAFLLLL